MKRPTRRKTKIVATLGPASNSPEIIGQMIEAGMNVARLNFSHGTHEDHSKVLNIVREEAQKAGAHIAVLQDLCGPKIRISKVENDEISLVTEETIELRHSTTATGSSSCLYVEAFDPVSVMKPGEKALLADGRIELVASSVNDNAVICRIKAGGVLRSRSGIAVPDSRLNLPCLTEKDLKDLEWAVENEVDYVALSFVSSGQDILTLRAKMKELGANIPIVAKIERSSALDNVTEIVGIADAAMVARGDLGLELPLERVPIAQKFIIEQANYHGAPVITATQMLQSMVNEVRPTRAEVSDVCTAVLDGTDAVMLSEETAVGKHPVIVIEYLNNILLEAERELHYQDHRPGLKGSDRETVADAICYAACGAAKKVGASAIVACTHSGYTARLVAKYRPQTTLFGATSQQKNLARMALYWGVQPIHFAISDEEIAESEINTALIAVRDQFGIKPGARAVITAGLKAKKSGTTTLMEIREVPRIG